MQPSDSLTSCHSSASTPGSPTPTPAMPPPPRDLSNSPPPIASPCAACKILRRRCIEQCVLAPYFPPSEPQKFITAHRVFGASNIIKLLQDLPEEQRADAVSSLVYEANARTRDPIYGCAGTIFQLQKQLSDLQSQLAMAQAEMLNMQTQQANLLALLCMEVAQTGSPSPRLTDSFKSNGSSSEAWDRTTLDLLSSPLRRRSVTTSGDGECNDGGGDHYVEGDTNIDRK